MNIRAIISILAVCLSLIQCASTASARQLRSWTLNGWTGGAYSNDQTGIFSHCAASIRYNSGILLIFGVDKTLNWQIGFENPAWRLRTGSQYSISYRVDRSPVLTTTASAVSNRLVVADLPANTLLFELFRKGRLLQVQGEGQKFGFSLDNTSSVLPQVLRCARAYVTPAATAASNNPFERPAPQSLPSKLPANYRAEAAAVVANVLSAARIEAFSIAPEIPPKLDFLHSFWTAPGLIGGLQILDGGSPSTVSTQKIANDAQSCSGTFASAKLPSSGKTLRVMTACTVPGKPKERVEYTILKRAQGGVYVFILIPAGGSSANVEENGSRLTDAVARHEL